MDKSQQYNTGHPHAAPNFRNLIIKPMWMTMKTALRTVPFLGRLGLLKNNYHGQEVTMTDDFTQSRIGAIIYPKVTHMLQTRVDRSTLP